MAGDISIFDPRRGHNYDFHDHLSGTSFSTRALGMILLLADGASDDSDTVARLVALTAACVAAADSRGFVAVIPWEPGMARIRRELYDEWPGLVDNGPILLARYNGTPVMTRKIFGLREKCGGSKSGEWLIGGASEELSIDGAITGMDVIFKNWNQIRSVLYLAEAGQSWFLTCEFAVWDQILGDIGIL
jgi:hypothetical protein